MTSYKYSRKEIQQTFAEIASEHEVPLQEGFVFLEKLLATVEPKKPIHSLPEKIDMEWPDEINKLVLAEKFNSIIDWLQAEKEK